MNPDLESQAWRSLRARAAAQIRPGFAERAMRAARAGADAMPSLAIQFLLGTATAGACALVVMFVHLRATQSEDARSVADWQQLAAAAAGDLAPSE